MNKWDVIANKLLVIKVVMGGREFYVIFDGKEQASIKNPDGTELEFMTFEEAAVYARKLEDKYVNS
jgi:hypothetical protein